MKYHKKPITVEAFTFDEFAEIATSSPKNVKLDWPFYFVYKGYNFYFKDEDQFIIEMGTDTAPLTFTRGKIMVFNELGEVFIASQGVFEAGYDLVEETKTLEPDAESVAGFRKIFEQLHDLIPKEKARHELMAEFNNLYVDQQNRTRKARRDVQTLRGAFDALENQLRAWTAFHPRAIKLIQKSKNFVVVAEDEPYYFTVYSLIRVFEMQKGRWTDEDEKYFHLATLNFWMRESQQKGEK